MSQTSKNSLKEQVAALPHSPGCYLFSDAKECVIYVGKAKDLRRRVSSYFVESRDHTPKVLVMVRQIVSLRYIVVDNETDALLLENSLIKSLQPRYNILLKDDKSYPWIAVTAEPFPRIQSTRQLVRNGSQYYGPYGSVSAQKAVLEFIKDVIPLRTCRLNLSQEQIDKGKYTPCLQYHIGNCKAPCCGKQSAQEYAEIVSLTVSILKGDLRPVKSYLEGEMTRAAAELRFEAAHRFKMRLEALEKYRSKSVIVSANMTDADIFSLYTEGEEAYCNFLRVKGGAIIAVQTLAIEHQDTIFNLYFAEARVACRALYRVALSVLECHKGGVEPWILVAPCGDVAERTVELYVERAVGVDSHALGELCYRLVAYKLLL